MSISSTLVVAAGLVLLSGSHAVAQTGTRSELFAGGGIGGPGGNEGWASFVFGGGEAISRGGLISGATRRFFSSVPSRAHLALAESCSRFSWARHQSARGSRAPRRGSGSSRLSPPVSQSSSSPTAAARGLAGTPPGAQSSASAIVSGFVCRADSSARLAVRAAW